MTSPTSATSASPYSPSALQEFFLWLHQHEVNESSVLQLLHRFMARPICSDRPRLQRSKTRPRHFLIRCFGSRGTILFLTKFFMQHPTVAMTSNLGQGNTTHFTMRKPRGFDAAEMIKILLTEYYGRRAKCAHSPVAVNQWRHNFLRTYRISLVTLHFPKRSTGSC